MYPPDKSGGFALQRSSCEHFRTHYTAPCEDRPLPDVPRCVDVSRVLMSATDTLAMAVKDARAAFDALMSRADIKRAEDKLTNGVRQRFDGIVQTAVAQLSGVDAAPDDIFPQEIV